MGANEKVFVQTEGAHLNKVITLYLEREVGSVLVSAKKTVVCAAEGETQSVELMV